MLLTLFLFVVMAATAGLVWLHGFWSNLVTLVNLLFAAMVAMVFYEPLTKVIVDQMSQYSYLIDFLTIWFLFAVTFGIMRLITDLLSGKRLQFHPIVELAGRSVSAVIIGYVTMMFTCATLHLAPIQASPFNGAWQSPTDASFLGMRPDAQWLSFMRGQSKMGLKGNSVFDATGGFARQHFDRRRQFESIDSFLD